MTMDRRDFVRSLGAGLLAALPVPQIAAARGAAPAGAAPTRFVERWSWAMGQSVHLQLWADSEDRGYTAAAAALAELRRVEARLSRFDDASDLAELNRRAGRGAMRVDTDLGAVLRAAERFRRTTRGAFDPAVEPLMRAWGFHRPRTAPPSERELAEAEAAVRAAEVRIDGDRVALSSRTTQLDPGGIGVGYGLDRMKAVLRAHGIGTALLDVSGDCLALGAPPGTAGWTVAIADSAAPGRLLDEVVLRDAALATSANTVSVVHWNGRTFGHVMDPRSGRPAGALAQTTVVIRSGLEADALSTAMLVSGRAAPGVRWALPRAVGAA